MTNSLKFIHKVLTHKKNWSLNWKAHFFKPRDSLPVRLSWQVWPGKIEGLVRACILRYLPIVLSLCKLYNWTLGAEPFIFEQGVVYIGRGVVLRGIMGKLFIETVITRGRGDRVSFFQYWVFVCQMNYTHLLVLPFHPLCLKNNFSSPFWRPHWRGTFVERQLFTVFRGVTDTKSDDEWRRVMLQIFVSHLIWRRLPHTPPQ